MDDQKEGGIKLCEERSRQEMRRVASDAKGGGGKSDVNYGISRSKPGSILLVDMEVDLFWVCLGRSERKPKWE